MARFKRILLKLSGESLMGEKQYGIDEKRLGEYAQQIKEIHDLGVQIGIVIGGGNIFRGLSGASKGFDRVKGDQMGMLATVINSLGLSSALGAAGVKARVLTAIRMEPIGEFYNKWKAIEAMENGEVVIMSAGTGNPFFTTDTGSSLRGIEIEADVMLKGTRVDGIYTADPEKDPTATKFDDITYDEVLKRGLKVMDLTATCMCKENNYQLFATVLTGVCYRLYADVIPNPNKEKLPDRAREWDRRTTSPGHAYQEMFNRRLLRGQSYMTPFLGWSEFTLSYFGPFRETTKVCKELPDIHIPSMLRRVFLTGHESNERAIYQAVYDMDLCIHQGVLEYPVREEEYRDQ